MAWKEYTVRINNNPALGTITQDVIEGIWDGNGAQGNYPALNNLNYLNLEIDEINGSVTYSANASIGTTKKDTVMTLLRVMGDMTINSWVTVTTSVRKLGLIILVKGNCTIDGILSMTARGANHNGSANNRSEDSGFLQTYPGRIIRVITQDLNLVSLSNTTVNIVGTSKNPQLPDIGASPGVSSGQAGASGIANLLTTGGGGAGSSNQSFVGEGAFGSTFSGGSGGGATTVAYDPVNIKAVPNGGGGGFGSGGAYGLDIYEGAGGAGNPRGGNGRGGTGNSTSTATDGTGGLLILIVEGTLTIGNTGQIVSRGSAGGSLSNTQSRGGGGSGGGSITLIAKNYSLTSGYTISASGGSGGSGISGNGGSGGNGSINIYRMDN